ncbi:TniQ family protein [Vibrio sp. 624788]|uniref:TniQ family protein n=1 Tax=Vibrio sp. 624788 TaxID=1234362 RepID=UPI00321ABEEC
MIRGSEVFPRSLLRTKSTPCCPLCLQQNGYASYLWHFEGYDHCHIHDVPLVNSCSCGAEFDYRESGLKGNCSNCKEPIAIKSSEVSHEAVFTVANWLAGNESKNLPDVPKSYRWGLFIGGSILMTISSTIYYSPNFSRIGLARFIL